MMTTITRPVAASSRGRVLLGLVLSAVAGGAMAAPLQGQARWWEPRSERGWIGISFEVTTDWRGRSEAILITDVMEDSPAERAGLRRGDRVLAINDLRSPRELASAPELLRVDAGDTVVLLVERDGDNRRFRVRAAPRPDHFAAERQIEVSLQADSLVETWSRAMESLRVRLVRDEDGLDLRVRGFGQSPRGPRGEPGVPYGAVVAGSAEPAVRVPFEFFVFRGEGHDSLRQEMTELNRQVVRLREEIRERERELRRRVDARSADEHDAELRRLRADLERMSDRSDRLETAMAEAARVTAGGEYGVVAPEARTVSGGERVTTAGEFRPLTPYLLGRNRVAGAEVIDLKPELARYFEVSSGVLVVDVAPGTPAAIAGIVPGDVITRIDQVAVRSVEELRFGVSVAEDSLPVTLIREGSSRQVLLRR